MARMSRARAVAISVAVFTGVAVASAFGSLGPSGAELRVHDPSAAFEGVPDVSAQGDGYVVAWYETVSGSDRNIYARRYGPDDAPRGAIVPVSTIGANEEIPRIDAASDGTFVVAWETDSDQSAARRFDADGTPLTGKIAAVTGGIPDVAVAADGTFVVVGGTSGFVVARQFAANGVAIGAEIQVGPGDQSAEPTVDIDAQGRVFVAWSDYTASGPSYVRVRGYDANLLPAFATKAPTDGDPDSFQPDVVSAADGFVVVWSGDVVTEPGAADGPIGRRFAPDGTPLGPPVKLDAAGDGVSRGQPRVTRGPGGGIVGVWTQGAVPDTLLVGRAFTAELAGAGDRADLAPGGLHHGVAALSGQVVVAYDRLVPGQFVDAFVRRAPYDLLGGTPITPPTPTPTPVTPTPTPSTPPPATVPPPKPAFAAVVTLPSTRKCVSRRSFRIRLRHPRGARILSAAVLVNGKKVATRRGKRVTAPVDLRGLPKGRFKITITVTLVDGRTVRGTRSYRTCAPTRN